jgi:hypothetical protein
VGERRPYAPEPGGAGEPARVVRIARPAARHLPEPANDNAGRGGRAALIAVPLLLATLALALLLAGIAG